MTDPEVSAAGWHPRFADYLYVSFTNASAFSPTDTMPLTRWAKLLMMLQSRDLDPDAAARRRACRQHPSLIRPVARTSATHRPNQLPGPRPRRVRLAVRKNGRMALQRMDNIGIVVESLDTAVSFFTELGLELEGRTMIELGAQVVDEVVQYKDFYRLCYVRGPEGVLIGLAEQTG